MDEAKLRLDEGNLGGRDRSGNRIRSTRSDKRFCPDLLSSSLLFPVNGTAPKNSLTRSAIRTRLRRLEPLSTDRIFTMNVNGSIFSNITRGPNRSRLFRTMLKIWSARSTWFAAVIRNPPRSYRQGRGRAAGISRRGQGERFRRFSRL